MQRCEKARNSGIGRGDDAPRLGFDFDFGAGYASRFCSNATEARDAVALEVIAIDKRIAEKEVRRADALAELRAGHLGEAVASTRREALAADVKELTAVRQEVEPHLTKAEAQLAAALADEQRAGDALKKAEDNKAVAQVDAVIEMLESKLLVALAERYRLSGKRNKSLWNLWSPTEALRRAVIEHVSPNE